MADKPPPNAPPLGELKYLYVGTSDFETDVAFYGDVLGGETIWNLSGFGARVAAFRLAEGPLILIADHRHAPSCMPVFAVPNLKATVKALKARGWKPDSGPVEIPDGPCYVFKDASSNELAVFGNERPDALMRRRR